MGHTWGSFDNSTPFKMAVGKNKRLSKGKKGIKKRVADPFTRKDWFDVKAPSMFETKNAGKTFVNRSTGLKNAADGLRGRVFELSLGDLNKDEENSYRKIKLRCDEVQGKNCLTNFYGMDFTSDKLRSMVRKWQTLIEAHIDVKTTDGYLLRLLHRLHQAPSPPGQEDHLREVVAGPRDPQEDVRDHEPRGVVVRPQGARPQARPRGHGPRDREAVPGDLPIAELHDSKGEANQGASSRHVEVDGAARERQHLDW